MRDVVIIGGGIIGVVVLGALIVLGVLAVLEYRANRG